MDTVHVLKWKKTIFLQNVIFNELHIWLFIFKI